MSRRPSDPVDPQDLASTRVGGDDSEYRPTRLVRLVLRFLRRNLNNQDVAEAAFLRARAEGRNQPIEQRESFLWRLAKQIARSVLNTKARQIEQYISDLDHSAISPAESLPEDTLTERQMLGLHCEAIAELRPQCRQVYLLRKVHGFSHKEIAAHLGLPLRTVEKHLMTALEKCERHVREREQSLSDGTKRVEDGERSGQ